MLAHFGRAWHQLHPDRSVHACKPKLRTQGTRWVDALEVWGVKGQVTTSAKDWPRSCGDGAPGEAANGKYNRKPGMLRNKCVLPEVTPGDPGDPRSCREVEGKLRKHCRTCAPGAERAQTRPRKPPGSHTLAGAERAHTRPKTESRPQATVAGLRRRCNRSGACVA